MVLVYCYVNRRVLAGVCANKDFAEGDLILKDQILVGAQHSLNKVHLLLRLIQHSLFIFMRTVPPWKYLHLFYVFCCRLTASCVVTASASLVL